MANRFRRPFRNSGVSNTTEVKGDGNSTQTGAADGKLTQDQWTGSGPAGTARLKAALDKLAELETALVAHSSGELAPPVIPAAQEAVAEIRTELQQRQPNQRALQSLLTSLGLVLSPAASLLAIVNGLRPLIEALFAQVH